MIELIFGLVLLISVGVNRVLYTTHKADTERLKERLESLEGKKMCPRCENYFRPELTQDEVNENNDKLRQSGVPTYAEAYKDNYILRVCGHSDLDFNVFIDSNGNKFQRCYECRTTVPYN